MCPTTNETEVTRRLPETKTIIIANDRQTHIRLKPTLQPNATSWCLLRKTLSTPWHTLAKGIWLCAICFSKLLGNASIDLLKYLCSALAISVFRTSRNKVWRWIETLLEDDVFWRLLSQLNVRYPVQVQSLYGENFNRWFDVLKRCKRWALHKTNQTVRELVLKSIKWRNVFHKADLANWCESFWKALC